jgi:hypothetical protein
VDKAFAYFFNDSDEPKLHAASGLTRNFQPKPAYHAVAWMLKNMADYRFSRVLLESADAGYAYEFTPEKPDVPKLILAWHPVKAEATITIPANGSVESAERMPYAPGAAERVEVKMEDGKLQIPAGERPVLLKVR